MRNHEPNAFLHICKNHSAKSRLQKNLELLPVDQLKLPAMRALHKAGVRKACFLECTITAQISAVDVSCDISLMRVIKIKRSGEMERLLKVTIAPELFIQPTVKLTARRLR